MRGEWECVLQCIEFTFECPENGLICHCLVPVEFDVFVTISNTNFSHSKRKTKYSHQWRAVIVAVLFDIQPVNRHKNSVFDQTLKSDWDYNSMRVPFVQPILHIFDSVSAMTKKFTFFLQNSTWIGRNENWTWKLPVKFLVLMHQTVIRPYLPVTTDHSVHPKIIYSLIEFVHALLDQQHCCIYRCREIKFKKLINFSIWQKWNDFKSNKSHTNTRKCFVE